VEGTTELTPEEALEQTEDVGYFAIVEPAAEELQIIRRRMMDGNPSTYWECEFVYATEPLIDPSAIDGTINSRDARQTDIAGETNVTPGD